MPSRAARPLAEFQHTPLWRAIGKALTDLETSGEVAVATAPEYVIGYLCQELAAKGIVTDEAITQDLGR
jgi:hypothetical protein